MSDFEARELKAALLARADQGDLEAQYELGWRHALGNGLPEDDSEAVKWLKIAAGNGHRLAQNNLGARYVSGEGVPADPLEAYHWFHLAAVQGDRKAEKNRDSVGSNLTPEQLQAARKRAGLPD